MYDLSVIITTYNKKENLEILIPKIYSKIKVK
jgi:glycosyltransferase involved in cell wall biosynthesis